MTSNNGSRPAPKFWKPNTIAPGSTIDRQDDSVGGGAGEGGSGGGLGIGSAQHSAALGIQGQRQRLPVYKQREWSIQSPALLVLWSSSSSTMSSFVCYSPSSFSLYCISSLCVHRLQATSSYICSSSFLSSSYKVRRVRERLLSYLSTATRR